jgi:hypothetical protein
VGTRAGLDSDRVIGVLPILMGRTSICDQFSEKERFVVRCFGWDFFFFFLEMQKRKIRVAR